MLRSANCWWSGIFWRKPTVDECRTEAADDRARSSPPVGGAAVRVGVDQPVRILPSACRRNAAQPHPDAADRRGVLGDAVVWLASDDAPSPAQGLHGRP